MIEKKYYIRYVKDRKRYKEISYCEEDCRNIINSHGNFSIGILPGSSIYTVLFE